jgi:hypothetical protein
VQNCEGVSGSWLASDSNQDAASSDEGLKNPRIVRLKSNAAHRPGQP